MNSATDFKFGDSLIYRRHSVRKFVPKGISPDEIEHILRAGMAAPSAKNSQPWEFIVVTERAVLEAIAARHPHAKMMSTAEFAIVPCVRRSVAEKDDLYQQGMGACVENMLLAAVECGLGSCWCAVHPRAEVERIFVELLSIPPEAFPFAVVAFGHPENESVIATPSDRFEASRVHADKW